ncbi:MFS transporter [Burkholderia multivorans]|nr:MFS transporter [Burkholderia multivorans]
MSGSAGDAVHCSDDGMGRLRKRSSATRVAFFFSGMSVAAWAPLVPYAKSRLSVDDAIIGLLLLCLGAGSIGCMPFCRAMVHRYGCRRVIISGAMTIGVSLPLLATMPTIWTMAGALLLFGVGLGLVDVAMNVHAVLVEQASGRRLMSGFHGMFSVGGIVGSVSTTALLSVGATPIQVACGVAALIGGLIVRFVSGFLTCGAEERHAKAVFPTGIVALMGAIALCAFIVEGAMLDWSALFLTAVKGCKPERAGFGYGAFAIAMTIARLRGDILVTRLGARVVISVGGGVGMVGLVMAVCAPTSLFSIAGFAISGIGCGNIVPLLFASAGRQRAMAPTAAIATLTTLGYGGGLAGPAVIGLLAHATGLAAAFLLLALLLGVAAFAGRKLDV